MEAAREAMFEFTAWLLGFREWLGSLVSGKGMRECFLHVGLWS